CRERSLAVVGDLKLPAGAVWTDHAHDMGHRAHPREQWGHRAAHRLRVDRALRGVEHDRVLIAALGLEFAAQQVLRALGLGPREAEVGRVVATNGPGQDRRENRDRDPPDHDATAMFDAPASEVQQARLLLGGTTQTRTPGWPRGRAAGRSSCFDRWTAL